MITGREAVRWIAGNKGKKSSFSDTIWCILSPKLDVEKGLCQIWKELDLEALDKAAAFIAQNWQNIGIIKLMRYSISLLPKLSTGLRHRRGLIG